MVHRLQRYSVYLANACAKNAMTKSANRMHECIEISELYQSRGRAIALEWVHGERERERLAIMSFRSKNKTSNSDEKHFSSEIFVSNQSTKLDWLDTNTEANLQFEWNRSFFLFLHPKQMKRQMVKPKKLHGVWFLPCLSERWFFFICFMSVLCLFVFWYVDCSFERES